MFENPITPSVTTEELLDARKKFEAEKLTRRAALKKFGITTGMAVFGMFAADDLARMVIKKMEETEATRQIAETVAHEFKNAGIAFADDSSLPPCDSKNFPHNWNCCNVFNQALSDDMDWYIRCLNNPDYTTAQCQSTLEGKNRTAGIAYVNCTTSPGCDCVAR